MKGKFKLVLLLLILQISSCGKKEVSINSEVINLENNWQLTSSENINEANGRQISTLEYRTENWNNAVVPGTVMGSLVADSVIIDPYFGLNLKKIDREQFKKSWWYRNEFEIKNYIKEQHVNLRFNGINYRANLWLNGKKVANKEDFAGAFRIFSFDISKYVKPGKNVLAIELFPPDDGEYTIGFVDWNPIPPDRNMGIFREVYLEINNGVKLRSPFVASKVDIESKSDAELLIQTIVENNTDKTVEGILKADFELGNIEKEITLKPHSKNNISFTSSEFDLLKVSKIKLWWPNGMGEPNLYDLNIEFRENNKILDVVTSKYGIREVESYLNDKGNRGFKINGEFVLIRGGGWVDDLLLQDTQESVQSQIEYVKQMNLNTIRLEGIWGKDKTIYDLCDQNGILIMAGWSCQWEWQEYLLKETHEKYGGATNSEDVKLLTEYMKDQVIWLRNHPSIFVWMLGSDKLPAPNLEKNYIDIFNEYDNLRPYVTSAGGVGSESNVVAEATLISDISGPTGMKMLGPYAYTPPVYWYKDTTHGGAYGFNTETCPGPNVPPLSSLKKMIPEDKLWPQSKEDWEYHAGRNAFSTLDRYNKAIEKRYGKPESIEEYAFKAQIMNYELMRPMFEAFRVNAPESTGLIQWMLNSSWPETYWQLYDSYLQPNGAYYATKKANNPLHAVYRYGFDDIYLINERLDSIDNLKMEIKVFDKSSDIIYESIWNGSIEKSKSKFILKLPKGLSKNELYFLDLSLLNDQGEKIESNFYWLSAKRDILDYSAGKKLEWEYYTPTKQYADFTAVNNMELAHIDLSTELKQGEVNELTVKLKNTSDKIAFFIYLDLIDMNGESVLPINWSDNYISILSKDSVNLSARWKSDKTDYKVIIRGVNVETIEKTLK